MKVQRRQIKVYREKNEDIELAKALKISSDEDTKRKNQAMTEEQMIEEALRIS